MWQHACLPVKYNWFIAGLCNIFALTDARQAGLTITNGSRVNLAFASLCNAFSQETRSGNTLLYQQLQQCQHHKHEPFLLCLSSERGLNVGQSH